MKDSIKVRRIKYDDIPGVGLLIRNTIRASYTVAYPPRAIDFFLSYHTDSAIEQRAVNGLVMVAERDGEIVATGSIVGNEITGVFVRHDLQGKGIGSIMMDELEAWATRGRYGRVTLSISLPSRSFYEKRGYGITGAARIDVGMGQVLDYWEGKKMFGEGQSARGNTCSSAEMFIEPEMGDRTGSPGMTSSRPVTTMEPIGVIRSPFHTKDDCPIQPLYAFEAPGRVEVFHRYEAGLKDIETFSHIYLFYLFDRSGDVEMVRSTFLDDALHGIFATRHPCRPNGIGASVVKLIGRDGNMLEVEGIDVLDNTPLLDIKPYIPRFDRIETANEGWVTDKKWRPKPPERE
ncbi:MAG: putative tRNA (adenine(37)-N6)-methyltransferase [Syntrophorhabdus sp. PtaU1.Bin058]|nr:MAG: putative tRNA (adenine(37)-N6)-methyltransferase [Syntrophorhabdus sp. PtaU1.Bin058]